jgi:hypothetical protein
MEPTPTRRQGEGDGPYDRLIIRGVTVIDGTGAPPRGPMDIVIAGDRIQEVTSVGYPMVPINERSRPAKGVKEIDGTGMYVMPGFIDLHVHCGGGQASDPDYVYKLWLAHGVTTVRGVPCGSMDWDLQQRELSAKNQIVAGGKQGHRRLEAWRPGSGNHGGGAGRSQEVRPRVHGASRSDGRRPHERA